MCFAGIGRTRLASSMARQKQDSGPIRMKPISSIYAGRAAESSQGQTKELRRDGTPRAVQY